MPTIIVIIPRDLGADLNPTPAIPFSAGNNLFLNITLQNSDSRQGPTNVFLTCTALNASQSTVLPLGTIVQGYTDLITVSPGTTSLAAEITTQNSITPGLLLLVQVVAFDGVQMGNSCILFQVAGAAPPSSTGTLK